MKEPMTFDRRNLHINKSDESPLQWNLYIKKSRYNELIG